MGCARLVTWELREIFKRKKAAAAMALRAAMEAADKARVVLAEKREREWKEIAAVQQAVAQRNVPLPPSPPPPPPASLPPWGAPTSGGLSSGSGSSSSTWSVAHSSPFGGGGDFRPSLLLPYVVGPNAPDYGSRGNPIGAGEHYSRMPVPPEYCREPGSAKILSDRPTFDARESPKAELFQAGDRLVRLTTGEGNTTGRFWLRESAFLEMKSEASRTGQTLESVFRARAAVLESWSGGAPIAQVSICTVPQGVTMIGYVGRASFQTDTGGKPSQRGGVEQVVLTDAKTLKEWEKKGYIQTSPLPPATAPSPVTRGGGDGLSPDSLPAADRGAYDAAVKVERETFKTVMANACQHVRSETLDLSQSTASKGTFGEAMTATMMLSLQGATLVGSHPKAQGIDSVWEKNGEYFVIDSKFGSSSLGATQDGRQMSLNWILARLEEAVGHDNAIKIANKGFYPCVAQVDANGGLLIKPLDAHGYQLKSGEVVRRTPPMSPWKPPK